MARLNRKVDGSGYYVQHGWTQGGVNRKCVYQISDQAVEILKSRQIRDGDQIPLRVFHSLREEGHLTTGGGGAREEIVGPRTGNDRTTNQADDRRQIPSRITPELMRNGRLISYGAFIKGWPEYSQDVLRKAYKAFEKEHSASLRARAETLLKTKLIEAITEEDDVITIILKK